MVVAVVDGQSGLEGQQSKVQRGQRSSKERLGLEGPGAEGGHQHPRGGEALDGRELELLGIAWYVRIQVNQGGVLKGQG